MRRDINDGETKMSDTNEATRASAKAHVVRPHVIHPGAVYGLGEAQFALGVAKTTLSREIRFRRLRVSKRGGKYFILGAWLLEWLQGGEVKRQDGDGEI